MLTERQSAILAFIQEFTAQHGYPPTVREISDAPGMPTTSVVNFHLNNLRDAGRIDRVPFISRGIRVVEPAAVAA